MTLIPDFKQFQELAASHNLIPVRAETVVDRLTPVAVYERLAAKEPYAFLLESVEGGERFGRYSFVGRKPHAVFQCKEGQITYRVGTKTYKHTAQNPLQELKALFAEFRSPELPGLPRFWGGAVGYWDYDTVRFFERLPRDKPDLLKLPTGAFQLSGELVILDRFAQTAQVISNIHIGKSQKTPAALMRLYKQAQKSIERQMADLKRPPAKPRRLKKSAGALLRPTVTEAQYANAVRKAQDYIRAGDIIQVVLSQRWSVEGTQNPFSVYRALRLVNPSPYMYLLHFPEVDIVGSSPELLVRKEQTHAQTRPIAGTRPRGRTPEEDEALAKELLSDPKERAEHLMLVDLGRNDLGRVCKPGSVRVPELMKIENYSHVMHIVSSVTGELTPKANVFDLFQACFPAGTVSGAPKIRAMEIIDELEPFKRGPYAGAVGYFSFSGNMDMAITIRTLVFVKGKAYLQAGAGIVAESVPAREFKECEHKAAAMLAALKKAGELS